MKELVKKIAEALVDFPEDIHINEILSNHTSVIELSVAKPDLGKIIGKRGRTAISIRTILNAAAVKLNRRVVLEILE